MLPPSIGVVWAALAKDKPTKSIKTATIFMVLIVAILRAELAPLEDDGR
jgi:hypothetical protein